MRSVIVLFILLVGVAVGSSVVAAQDQASVTAERPWARASIGTSRPAAAYLTLVNTGSDVVRLVGIESPVSDRAEVHRTVKEGEVMRMEPAGDVPVPQGERVVFAPGGLHIMLMDLRRPLDRGGTFPLTLRFADGGMIEVTVPVLGPGSRGPGE